MLQHLSQSLVVLHLPSTSRLRPRLRPRLPPRLSHPRKQTNDDVVSFLFLDFPSTPRLTPRLPPRLPHPRKQTNDGIVSFLFLDALSSPVLALDTTSAAPSSHSLAL